MQELPDKQAEQVLDAAEENVPAPQEGALVDPSGQYDPAVHVEQLACPSLGWYFPASQILLIPLEQENPGGHLLQATAAPKE